MSSGKTSTPRSPRATEVACTGEEAGGLLASIKTLRRKKHVHQRLHPLESDSPRRASHHHPQRHLSVSPTSPHHARVSAPSSPRPERPNTGPGETDDEVAYLQQLHAQLTSEETVEQWIHAYEVERGNFASFAVFTEVKLDEVQEAYVGKMGRPNAVEAAACCATLLKMPGIVGCYRSLLEKVAAGIEGAIYLPDVASAPQCTGAGEVASTSSVAMASLVKRFYSRTPYFERVRDLEKTLRSSRSLTDPDVLRAISSDDVARIFQYVPFCHVRTGIAEVYGTNSAMLDQLVDCLQEKQGLQKTRNGLEVHDTDYPVHVPLATSAQICRAIAHNAASFSSSGRDMIMCAILELVDVESFRDIFRRFEINAKVAFLHHLSLTESSDELQAVVEALPDAGESLFRLYFATCAVRGGLTGMLGDGEQVVGEQMLPAIPKDVFFLKLLSSEMEFFFLCDLAAYMNEAQWQLLSKEFEKNERNRRALKKQGSSTDDFDFEVDEELVDANARSETGIIVPSATASIDRFQMMMWSYLRHHALTSAQMLQLVANTFLSGLQEKEFSQLLDSCWARFPIHGRWSKVLAVVQELGASRIVGSSAGSSPSTPDLQHDVSREYVAAIRLKLLKKIFAMLSREERAVWLDKMNTKFPTENYKKKIEDIRKSSIVLSSAPPDLSNPNAHVPHMKTDLKVRWLEVILNSMANDVGQPAHTASLMHTLETFLSEQAGSSLPSAVTLVSTEETLQELLDQLDESDRNAFLSKFSSSYGNHLADEKSTEPTVDRATSPLPELKEDAPTHPLPSSQVLDALQALLGQTSEAHVVEVLQRALGVANDGESATRKHGKESSAGVGDAHGSEKASNNSSGIPGSLKRKLSAVTAVAEPIEWQEYVKVGYLDIGCQTNLDDAILPSTPDEKSDILGPLGSDNTTISPHKTPRISVVPGKAAPLTLSALLGKHAPSTGTSGGKRDKKDSAKYQKMSSTAVPRSIAGLITSWRMNADQLVQFSKKSQANVLKIIGDAYSDLLTAGRRKTQQQQLYANVPRGGGRELTLSQIVYQSFLHSYGLPGIADMHLLAFSCALEAYRVQHLRVEYFARFCFEEVPKSELTNYLEFLECLVCDDINTAMLGGNQLAGTSNTTPPSGINSGGLNTAVSSNARGLPQPAQHQPGSTLLTASTPPAASKRLRFVPRIAVPDKENWMISLERAQEAAQLCFRDMRKSAVAAFCENLAVIASEGGSTAVLGTTTTDAGSSAVGTSAVVPGGELLVNADHLLQLVVQEWRAEQRRRENHLLDAFHAGDVNGDGQLTSAEFTQIVLSIDQTRDLGDILLMYSDTLRRTQCDLIDAQVFLQVARENDLDRVVWSSDGDLYNVVNEVTDMEATWAHVRDFFVGTLEALARDLPPSHFLRMCEGAGCGCLKCLLDGYIGFQKMRREFALAPKQSSQGGRRNSHLGVSSQLVWARFWHLTRQLHDAAAESEGIISPWEGAEYIREKPAPPLAPRDVTRRRGALPNFLFPDTDRITAKTSAAQHPEAFDADSITAQFAYLLSHMSFKALEAASHA